MRGEGAPHLAADTVLHGHLTASHRTEFIDEERKALGAVRFDKAVEIRP